MKLLKLTGRRKAFAVLAATRSVQAAIMDLAPGQSTGETSNEHPRSEQWLLVLSGSGRAVVKRRSFALRRHALLLIAKGEIHQIINRGRKPLRLLNFYAPPAYSTEGDVKPSAKRG